MQGFVRDGRKGYEEARVSAPVRRDCRMQSELGDFKALLAQGRTLPTNFTRDVIMKAPTHDMMNSLSRSVLTLASYDSNADDISLPNVLRQCLMLIAVFPMLAVYSYHAYNHYECGGSMYIHYPSDSLSTASNLPAHAAPGYAVHAARGKRARSGARAAYGARRRQQFLVHHARRYLLRHGYLFGHCSGARFAERPETRRRELQGRADVRGYEAATCRTPTDEAGSRGLSCQAAAPRGL